jgi:hypothetical protein
MLLAGALTQSNFTFVPIAIRALGTQAVFPMKLVLISVALVPSMSTVVKFAVLLLIVTESSVIEETKAVVIAEKNVPTFFAKEHRVNCTSPAAT